MRLQYLRIPPAARYRWALLLACLLQALAGSGSAHAAASESAVKAAFLYKFAGFVEWPPDAFPRPGEPVVIGVLGNDAVASDLAQVAAGRTLQGRPLMTRRLREGEPIAGVHVLMVGATREARLRELAQSVPGSVLLVTEQEGALAMGSVLNFSVNGGRVRFSASLTSAEARQLRLSARLLAVAQRVEGSGR
jgi:hypothetical protein